MDQLVPSFLMGFREGLEAFLLIVVILQYLTQSNNLSLKKKVMHGVFAGLFASIALGLLLNELASSMGGVSALTKTWESVASFVALILVTLFIIWMIKRGGNMVKQVHDDVDDNLSAMGLFFISFVVIAREGTEIAIFSFAGKYPYAYVLGGVLIALVLAVLIHRSLVRVNLGLLFKITLAYLILQAGFLVGYSIHEGLSALKAYGQLSSDSMLFTKAFNASKTVLSHKDGVIGIPLHVLFGWYSKPEVVQFVIQYTYTAVMLLAWRRAIKPQVAD